jgi:hypothetical protein
MLDWEEESNVFNKFCHTYLFQRLYKSNLFWGVRIIGEGITPIPCTVYLSFFGFERVVKDNYPEELHGCSSCNNECSSLCLLDFLWCRGRITPLRNLMSCVFNTFINEHKNDMKPIDLQGHKIIEHLYGENRFPAGGGIKNTQQIYEVARLVHYQELIEEGAQLSKKLKENAESLTLLMESKIQMMKLFI